MKNKEYDEISEVMETENSNEVLGEEVIPSEEVKPGGIENANSAGEEVSDNMTDNNIDNHFAAENEADTKVKGKAKSWAEKGVSRKFLALALGGALLLNAAITTGIMAHFNGRFGGKAPGADGRSNIESEEFMGGGRGGRDGNFRNGQMPGGGKNFGNMPGGDQQPNAQAPQSNAQPDAQQPNAQPPQSNAQPDAQQPQNNAQPNAQQPQTNNQNQSDNQQSGNTQQQTQQDNKNNGSV